MDIKKIEEILERKVSDAEKNRLQKIETLLGIKDNDALWTIIIALEYQRDYYQALPEKIQKITSELELKIPHSVKSSEKTPTINKIILTTFSMFFVLFLGAFSLCLGYKLSGQVIILPQAIFSMPVGYVLAATLLFPALPLTILSSKSWIEDDKKQAGIKAGLAAFCFALLGWILATLGL